MELIGANVAVKTDNDLLGASTDLDGSFKIENVPVGRVSIEISYLGYETQNMSSVLITSGKEMVLEIGLIESTTTMDEVVVKASAQEDKTKALNSFATVSSRTFSVEETSRYAAASFDPARMAQNYAGVSIGAGADLFNEIVIRGNSPGGVLWRLDGIEIPNPNHFGAMGNSGGAISMLSSSTLSNSDFYTGAFPSEFGNATSGVFDLNMRKGNNQKREYSFMFGALGVELAAEGPFSKKSGASYLINYRYSTLALLQATGINPTGDVLPTYQDLSFKLHFPTKKAGNISIFGLGGNNLAAEIPAQDSSMWEYQSDREGFDEVQDVGTVGATHRLLLSNNSYLRTVVAGSFERVVDNSFTLDDNYNEISDYADEVKQTTYRASTMYHNKLNAKNSMRLGGIYSAKKFNFFYEIPNEEGKYERFLESEGSSGFVQAFAQWKHRFNDDLTLNTGLHYSLLTLNNKMAIEPRMALTWKMNNRHTLSASVGMHSKMEHLALYTINGIDDDGDVIKSRKNLGLTKSIHNVIGYDFVINPQLRLKAEAYYQHLYDIPILSDPNSKFSILNTYDIWDYIGMPDAVSDGQGRNVGLDLTLEKFFSQQYYFMLTGSLYDSKYKAKDGKFYNTRFNGNYMLNVMGGKEFTVGKKDNSIFGLNAKYVMSGGNRYTAVNLEESIAQDDTVRDLDNPFGVRSGVYYRFDVGISFKINKKRLTHSIMLDIQNVTNRENVASKYYNEEAQRIETDTQTGLFPFFNYRIEF